LHGDNRGNKRAYRYFHSRGKSKHNTVRFDCIDNCRGLGYGAVERPKQSIHNRSSTVYAEVYENAEEIPVLLQTGMDTVRYRRAQRVFAEG